MVLIKTAIINTKTGETEYKDIETAVIPIIKEEESDNEKLLKYAKIQGWI